MLNIERTKEVFGYDVNLEHKRRTKADILATNGVQPKKLKVIDNCPSCNIERTIKLKQSRKNKPCPKCFHNLPSTIAAKQNQKKEKSEESKQKMRENHWSKRGGVSAFKGKQHSEEVKKILSDKTKNFIDSLSDEQKLNRHIKGSCTVRGISVDEFDGWATDEDIRIRGSLQYKQWESSVVLRDKKCRFPGCLERRRGHLVAHHKDGFSWCHDRRFDVDNGVLLCKFHHTDGPIAYHKIYGNSNATEIKFNEWIQKYKMPEQKSKIVYVLTGAPGSGKSWVCEQLTDKYTYISYDDFSKESHLQLIYSDTSGKPILYDPWRKATSFIKRYQDTLDIRLIVIKENLDTVSERLIGRGGKVDEKTKKYVNRAFNIARGAHFSGTSNEVLNYLKQELAHE